jgi:hypothetical protein
MRHISVKGENERYGVNTNLQFKCHKTENK